MELVSVILLSSLVVTIRGCEGTGCQKKAILPKVLESMGSLDFKHTSWTIQVVEMKTGEVMQEVNPDAMFDPAYTHKRFVVSAALDVFGSDYCFETPVDEQGELSNGGALNGNLILLRAASWHRATGSRRMGGSNTWIWTSPARTHYET